jgi:hypothetical protein
MRRVDTRQVQGYRVQGANFTGTRNIARGMNLPVPDRYFHFIFPGACPIPKWRYNLLNAMKYYCQVCHAPVANSPSILKFISKAA